MTTTVKGYEELIKSGIQGLPPETLAEIADFVFFKRRKAMQPDAFAEELYSTLLHTELKQFSQQEIEHLEQEFADYERRYPKE